MKTGKPFDEHIRRTLENLERSYNPDHWDILSQRMDEEDLLPADEVIRDRMDTFEAPLVPGGSWDALEQLIEADEAAEIIEEEAPVDEVAYEKLHNFEVPYSDHHWALMARRLEEEFSLRHKLYRYKVAEITLMALLLLTIIRLIPFAGQLWHQPSTEPVEQIQPQQNTIPPYETGVAHNGVPKVQQQQNTIPTYDAPAKDALPGNPVVRTDGTGTNPPSRPGNLIVQSTPGTPGEAAMPPLNEQKKPDDPSSVSSPPEQTRIAELKLTNIASLSDEHSLFDRIMSQNLERDDKWASLQKRSEKSAPDLLAVIDPYPVNAHFNWELPALNTVAPKKPGDLRFSIFTATDLNYVRTPPDQLSVFDTLVRTDPNFTIASGYGGGVLVSWKKNRMEFQAGGLYSFKRYIPNTPVFLFETVNYYIKEDFHGIQLDILQVPVNMQYHFKNTGNWRFYGTAGASGHFITSSVYEIEYKRTPTFSALMPPASTPDDTRSIRQEKEFPNGLLDGGRMQDNFYITANLGVGVERFVAPKWAVFFQPNYQHYLMSRGIGTNNDKIYTLSFYLGTKFSLK